MLELCRYTADVPYGTSITKNPWSSDCSEGTKQPQFLQYYISCKTQLQPKQVMSFNPHFLTQLVPFVLKIFALSIH